MVLQVAVRDIGQLTDFERAGALIATPRVSLADYPALFGATAPVATAASIGVWQIKSVR